MKFVFGLFIIGFLAGSCTSYQATVKKYENLEYDKTRVYPDWQYQEQKGKKWITPVIGLSAGAAYGYQTEFTYDGKTYKEAQNAAIWGGAGLLAGMLINGIIFPKKRSNYKFDLSQSDKWIDSYNKTTGKDLLIQKKEMNNSLILVPRFKVLQIRQESQDLEQDLKSANPSTSIQELQDWKTKLKAEYSILQPSEIEYLNSLIASSETKVANSELMSKVSDLSRFGNDYSSISGLSRMRGNYQSIYSKADESTQAQFDNQIREKISTILRAILPDEKQKLDQIANNLNDLGEINSFHDEFNRKYGNLRGYQEVDALYSAVSDKKAAIISGNLEQISNKIKNSVDNEQLSNIEKYYLAHINSGSPEVVKLQNQLSQRRNEIIAEKNRKRIAAEEAKRKRKQEINRIAAEQQRIKNRRAQAVKNKRRELNLKYGTYFPTLDDLFEVLNLVPLIENPVRVEDKRRFIGKAQTFGFELANDNGDLYADINTFKNNRNYELKTLKFKASNNRGLTIAAMCIFPNAPRDIIELYAMELNSEYRERTNPYFNKKDGNVRLLKESPQYIKSGGTIYYYEIDDGTLEVSALGNFDASGVVLTERLNHNTLKVNSYSNLTDIRLNEGDVIKFDAWGSVTLGFLAGSATPAGINGFELYSIDSRHKHGSLIGRIDEGNWFYIGNARTIVAPASGTLELKINDTDRSNNDGFFYVTYSIEKQKTSN